MLVSGQFFQAMETPPLLGRYLTPQDDQPGGNPAGLAVVISEDFWNNWFNRAPDVVGRTMVIANTQFTVVGVMPKRFIGPDPTQRPEIYAPLSADPSSTRRGIILLTASTHGGSSWARGSSPESAWSRPTQHCSLSQTPFCMRPGRRPKIYRREGEGTFPFRGRPGFKRIYIRALSFPQASRGHVRHVRRNSAAGLPESGQPVDGARRVPESASWPLAWHWAQRGAA